MWKIKRLYLRNFIHIYAGMNKKEVELDLSRSTKKINIFIGKMGSGKSSILGHLQPFSTYGTLDIRNQEDLIIPGEDGLKEIEFLHNSDIYTIQHKYIWNKNGNNHSTKSYIQLNGHELNDNGNTRSFKEIIRTEFGIDQNFLRLLRLGPNVANLINMKSTERKSFIASLLKDTEIYTTLHQKLTEEYRNMNSTLSVLSSKLVGLSSEKENDIRIDLEDFEEQLNTLYNDIEKRKNEIARLKGINSVLLEQKSLDVLTSTITDYENRLEENQENFNKLQKIINDIPDIDLQDISIQFGELNAKLDNIYESIVNLQSSYTKKQTEATKAKEVIMLQNNDEQLNEMKKKAHEIKTTYERYVNILANFQCNYSYAYLTSLPEMIQAFQIALEEMSMNRKEVIGKIYNSDSTIISWAKKKIQILTGTQINMQKLLSNLKFSSDYSCPIPLYRPPKCPTNDCPFIQSHPQVIKELSKDNRNSTIIQLKEKLDALEIEIAIHEEYIIQYPKMQILKKMWANLSSVLDILGVLQEKNLYRMLVSLDSRCNWYSHDDLIAITEKEKMKEDFVQLQNQYYKIKNEMLVLQDTDTERKKEELTLLEKEMADILRMLEEKQMLYQELSSKRDELEKLLATIKNIEYYKSEKTKIDLEIKNIQEKIVEVNEKIEKIRSNTQAIQLLENEVSSLNMNYTETNNKIMKLRMILQEISSTKSSYQQYLDERNTIKIILDAVSSKDGIPLVMVKVFLDECKEIINELISDVFDDDLEIISFDISENSNEFKIPYRVNGNEVSDIELASQGQSAIISIAMSFALCRKSMFDYNIMLLDEIDNSIYKADREKFIMILAKQMQALNTEQVFLITHNDIFQQSGLPVNIIMTTNEIIDSYPNQNIIELY